MAGLLLAIELHRRRTHSQHHLHEDNPHNAHPSYRLLLEPPTITAATTTAAAMDEAALKARQRLEEKLGDFRSSNSRLNRVQANEGSGNTRVSMRDNHNHGYLVTRMLGRPWNSYFHINKSSKSKGQLCAICLEDFHAERQVMELSCSHKYHSDCLLPWLANHPNCPSCRTPIPQ